MALRKKANAIMATVTIALLLIIMFALPSFAESHPKLDPSKKGSITMIHKAADSGKRIAGSKMVAYKVADAVYENGDAVFEPVDELENYNIKSSFNSLTESDEGAADLAAKVYRMVKEAGLSGKAQVTDSKGKAIWTGLDVGLYLIVNVKPAEGYKEIPAYLISVPRLIDGEYVYDVETAPKPSPAKEKPPTPPDDTLPQTGQLWWPVPVLAGAGMILIGIGAYRRRHA